MEPVRRIDSAGLGRSRGYGVNVIIENLSHARCQNGAGRTLRAVASVALAAASLVAPAAAYGAVPESKNGENITFSIPTSLRCAVRADGTVIAPSGWSMSNSGSGKVEITGVSVSNAIGKLKLSGKSGTIGYAVGNGNGSYSVSYDAASDCKFSSTSNRPLGIESGKSLSWNWNIGKLNASDHRAALDAAASGRARLCDMSFSYAPVGNSLSSEGTTGSMSGTVNSQSSSVMPVGGTATANVGNAPSNASLSYQWYTVDSNGSYSAIANANGKTLKVLAAYRGKDIVCRVSDSSGHYSGYVETARKPVRNLTPKVGISGSSVYGNKLTATVSGLPSGATYTYKYKWQRLFGSSWTDIANATAAEYTLGGEDVGKQVRVIVSTASNIYTVDDVTAVSATVAKAKASIGVSISGTKNNSSRLTASVNGLPAAGTNTVSYRWQRSSDGKSNWVDSTASDAKSNSIQMQPNDVSWHYRCIVSASNLYYDIASSTSAAYGPIAKSTVSAARATISGNAVYGGTIKANVTNVPTVGTNSISYQWQYSEDGKAWNDTRLDGGKTSSLVLSAVSCVGTQYRCVISVDNSYYIVPGCSTGGIKVGKASAQAVAKASGEAVAGKALTVAVSGLPTVGGTNKIYYQWQFSNDGKTWSGSTLDGATTSTLHLYDSDNVAHSMVGFSYRCIVSVSGNSAYDIKSATSNVIGPVVKGTAAAPSVSVGGTKKIESTLKATVTSLPKYGNSNVSYQWQTSADGSTWADSTQSDAKSVSFKPAYSLVGKYVRCAVSVSNDQYNVATGYSAAFGKLGKASKTISAAIISPNKRNGDTLTCGISGLASNGANTVAYKWEMTLDSAFKTDVRLSEDKGNTHITAWGTNTYYRCTVTASNPYYEYNTAVSPIYGPLAKGVASAPTVTVSGSNAWGSTLKATVTGLPKYGNTKVSYQWEARDDSSTTWGNSGYATATTDHITIDAQDAVSKARHYRCKVTVDNDQYTVPVAYSADHGKTVKALATSKVAISGTSAVGGKLTCSVSGLPTSGSNTVSYQWQYSNDNRAWTNSTYTDAKTSSHSLGYKDAYNLYWRCTVSVSGNQYYNVNGATSASKLCVKGTASITASVSGSAVIGGKLTCSVGGLPSIGTNSVSYKWQYSADGGTWTDSSNSGAKTNVVSLPPDGTLGKRYRCVVTATNSVYNNMSATSAASAAIGKGTATASVTVSGSKVYGATLTANPSQPTGTTGTSYQWQRNTGTNGAWVNISNATGKTYVAGTADVGHSVRVLMNTANTYYNVSQCASAAAAIGKATTTATATVSGTKAVGSKLTVSVGGLPSVGTNTITYKWQCSSDNKTWTDSNSAGASSNALTTDTTWLNKYARCVITVSGNAYYNVNGTTSAAYGPIGKGSHAAPSVSISGAKTYGSTLTANVSGQPTGTTGTTYQWQRADATNGTYANISNATGRTYSVGTADMNKYLRVLVNTANTYYNVSQGVSAGYGAIGKATSSPSVRLGGTALTGGTLTCTISGLPAVGTNNIAYQWQYSKDGSTDWTNSSYSDAKTNSLKLQGADLGWHYRCSVSFSGNAYYDIKGAVTAASAVIGKGTAAAPKVTISGGKSYGSSMTANVSGQPSGTTSTSYQWQFSSDGGKTWSNSAWGGATTNKIPAFGSDFEGKYFRCVVTTASSQWNVPVAYSAAFGPLVKGSASISATLGGSAVVGGKLTASVGGLPSSGTNTVSYQWQSSKDGKSWTNSTTGNTKALSTGDLGLHYRCHVSATNPYYTIASGYTAASAAIGKGTVNASVHVSGTKSVGSKLTANVSGLPGTGTNTVAYKWQWSKDGSTGWTDSSYTDAKASSIVMHAEDVGYYYRCVITVSGNAYYNINGATSAAYGPMGKGSHAAPTVSISGTKAYGYTLTANISGQPGGTTGTTYQWQRNSGTNGAWVNISNATGKTYVLTGSDMNHSLRVLVNTSNTYYNVSQGVSAAYGTVGKASKTISASVSGTKNNTSRLTVSVSGLPTVGTNTISYQWQWSKDGSTGWTDSTYSDGKSNAIQMKEADVAYYYRCVVSVSGNAYYNVTGATTAAYGPMAKSSHGAPTVSVSGSKTYGSTLTANVSGQPNGTTATSYQWQRASSSTGTWANISNATGKTYKLGTGDMNQYFRVLVGTTSTYYTVAQGVSPAYGAIGKASTTVTATVSGTKTIGSKLTVSVGGLPSVGTNTIAYRWQYSSDNKTWTDSNSTGAKSNAITTDTTWINKYARCIVTVSGNAYYNVNGATSAAYGPIGKASHSAPSVSISGSKVYGAILTANVSGQPSGTTGTTYQWQRADSASGSYSNIANATGKTYVAAAGDMGKYLRVLVNTANTYYNVSQGVSAGYGAIGKASHSAPSVSVSGDKSVGSTLTANVSGQPSGTTSTTYQWQRASSASGSYSNISGATGKTYKAVDADANKYVRVLVNTTNTYYNVSQGVSSGYGTILGAKSFAVYSDGDKSLKFYRRASVPKITSTFNGQIVTELYENIESTSYASVPWSSHAAQIEEIDIVDSGIRPTSISGWFNGATALAKMNNISKLDVSATKDMSYAFSSCEQLTKIDLSSWNTASCTNMSYMFNACKQLMQVNVSSFRTSSVTDFSSMFYQCSNITDLDISNFDTRNAKSISLMMADTLHMQRFKIGANFKIVNTNFVGTPLSINIPGADSRWHSSTGGIYTSATIPSLKADTYYALANRTCVQQAYAVYSIDDNSLSFYKRSDVPDIGHIFNGKTATRVYPNIEAYDDTTLFHASPWSLWVAFLRTAKVVDSGIQPRSTAWWFYLCTAMTTCDLSKLDTSKCVNMCWMFRSCSSLTTLDVSKLDTHLVTDLSSMFRDSPELGELDVRNWNVSKATNMGNMFNSCRRLTDLTGAENWNTSSNEHFDYMFANCVKLTLNASRWDTSAAKGATKHTGFNSMAPGVRAPQWHGLIGLNATSVDNDSNPDMPSDDIAVDSNGTQDDKSVCDRNGNSDTTANGTIHDNVDNSDNVDSVDSDNVDNVDSDIENQRSSDDMTSQESLPEQLE